MGGPLVDPDAGLRPAAPASHPVDANRRKALPVLPLPAVGTVYGTPERAADRAAEEGGGDDEPRPAHHRRPGGRRPAAPCSPPALGIALVVVRARRPPPSTGIEQIPLPGGADLGDHPYEITAEFGDVLSLAPQSSVKVNDVAVGRVTGIALAAGRLDAPGSPCGSTGRSTCPPTPTPASNSPACSARSSSSSRRPPKPAPPAGSLADGGRIPLARTNRNPEVEEVFGALSLLLNGGGVNQLKTITTELNKALAGREPQIRSMLNRVDTLVTNLDDQQGRHHPGPRRRQPARRHPRHPQAGRRHGPHRAQPRPQGPGEAARLAAHHAALPRHALHRRRRHHQPEQGRHDRRPQGARPDPQGARRLRQGPARLPPGAAHLPVHGRGAARRQGRLPQRLPGRDGRSPAPRSSRRSPRPTRTSPRRRTSRAKGAAAARNALPLPLPAVRVHRGTEAPEKGSTADDHSRHPAQEHRLPRRRRTRPRLSSACGTPISATTSGCAATTP